MKMLRALLILDSAVLLLLGCALIFIPHLVALAFGFKDLPPGMGYIIGQWGCVLGTLSIGYFAAAVNPIRHVVWVQVGIARGVLECLLGMVYILRGIVTWQQAGFGIIIAGLMALGYLIFYPREVALPATNSANVVPVL
ncbi:MAG: hypothetical protein JO316_15340 [Abitibacteriaceae bacterium]|nr:hypothetical protein [Abditibacteriaceae bacterium]